MRALLAELDTPGGHIIVCLVAILLGAGLMKVGISKGEDLIVGGGAVLFAAMRGRGGATV